MEKRVTFKNASNQTNKRARLTHGEGGVVNVGNQTGAVYYARRKESKPYSIYRYRRFLNWLFRESGIPLCAQRIEG